MKAALLLAFLLAVSSAAEDKRVVVISHRGEHLRHVENTLSAFQAAIDAGADYFECDVRTTSNGRLVLMHDGTVDRTTNGKGRVSALNFAQIRALDAVSYTHLRAGCPDASAIRYAPARTRSSGHRAKSWETNCSCHWPRRRRSVRPGRRDRR